MHYRRARDGHLRHDTRVRFEELEVLEHRMVGEAELAFDADALCLGLHALKLDTVIRRTDFDAVEHAEEIEMPPRAAEFTVGRELEPDLLLLLDDLLDLAVLDRGEVSRTDLALFPFGARLLQRRRAQNAADHVGAERRLASHHWRDPPRNPLERTKPGPRLSSTANRMTRFANGRRPNQSFASQE